MGFRREPIGYDPCTRTRRHGTHVLIVHIENGSTVNRQGLDQLPFLFGRGLKSAEVLVVVAAYGGDDADLGPEHSHLASDLAWTAARQLLRAEPGCGTDRQKIGDDVSNAVISGIGPALADGRQQGADQPRSRGLAATPGDPDIGNITPAKPA